jgi:DNA polymerase-3 subunit gamma/tau
MSYLVLARKYRPAVFEDVIGQEHISGVLKNAISNERIAHAYLFSGPRGSGKTTMARIFAKALNCKNGPTPQPCGICDNCIEITKGNSLDVLELDGASNRGIGEIKDLMDNARFSAAKSKYKIYIIDEAHQITKEAFNALLKTLEEPPENVVFIMATTEQHKFPITILSRCQRYRFKLLSAKEISQVIKKIGEQEGFEIDEQALSIIINASGGSMRDALSLLDQVVSSGIGKISGEYIRSLLGFLPKEIIFSITENLAKGDMKEILKTVSDIANQGYDILQFAKDLRDYLRQIMICDVSPDILDMSLEDKKLLEKQKGLFSPARHIRMNNLISRAIDEMRWNDQQRIMLEMYLLKMAESYYDVNTLLQKIGDLEKRVSYSAGDIIAPTIAQDGDVDIKDDGAKDLLSVWKNIIASLSIREGLMASELNNLIAQSKSDTEIALSAKTEFSLELANKFKEKIISLFKEKTGRAIKVEMLLNETSAKNADIKKEENIIEPETESQTVIEESEESSLFVANDEKENKSDDIPDKVKNISQKFGGKVRKIDKK